MLKLVVRDDVDGVRSALMADPSLALVRGGNTEAGILAFARTAAMVDVLVGCGLDVNDRDSAGITPLHRAAQGAAFAMARRLLELGADPMAVDDRSQSALHWLSLEHHKFVSNQSDIVGTAALLIDAGTPTGSALNSGVSTPLNMNAAFGRLDMVQLLVSSGADPTVRDGAGMNALHCAARHPNVSAWLLGWAKANGRTWKTPITDTAMWDGHHHRVRVHPDGRHALTTKHPGAIATWNLGPEPAPRSAARTDGPRVIDVAFLPDGASFLCALLGGPVEVRSWDDPQRLLDSFACPVDGAVAVAPSGLMFAICGDHEEVHIIDTDDGRVLSMIEGGEYTNSMDWSHDGIRLAIVASYQGGSRVGVALIDPGGTVHSQIDIHVTESDRHATPDCEEVCGVRFAPDDTSLIFWQTTRSDFSKAPPGWRGNLVCSTPEGQVRWLTPIDQRLTGETVSACDAGYSMGFYTEPAFSADGRLVAAGVDGHLLELNATTGTLLEHRTISGVVHSISYSNYLDSWVLATSHGLQLHQRTARRTNSEQDTSARE